MKKSFEERLGRLEELGEQIRSGSIPIEEAVSLFEEGMKLAGGLEKELAKIERKIEILMNDPATQEEKPDLELFPDLENDGE